MQIAEQMHHLNPTETYADNRLVAKIIIMIYEVNKQGHLEAAQRLRNQFRLQDWDYIELAHKDAIPVVALQNIPFHILGMKEFVATEKRFFENLKQFIEPSYINSQGVKVTGGWEFIKKYLTDIEIKNMQELIDAMRQLYQAYCNFQFTQDAIVASVMDRLEKNNPQLFFAFWVEFLHISSIDQSPFPLFHSILPYQFVISDLNYFQNIKQTRDLIINKLRQISEGAECKFVNAPTGAYPSDYLIERLLTPVQRSGRYGLIFSEIIRNMNNINPYFDKMFRMMTFTHGICTGFNNALRQVGASQFIKLFPKWIVIYDFNFIEGMKLIEICLMNPNAKNVPFYMKKYQLTFNEAIKWASRDLQNWFFRYGHLRKILTDDIYFYIATFLAPITESEALTIFSKVLPKRFESLSLQVLKNYLTGTVTKLTMPTPQLGWMERALNLSASLFAKETDVSATVVPHYMNAARLYRALSSNQDFSELRDILLSSAKELKEIIDRPDNDRYEHFIDFLLQKLDATKLIDQEENNVPRLR